MCVHVYKCLGQHVCCICIVKTKPMCACANAKAYIRSSK